MDSSGDDRDSSRRQGAATPRSRPRVPARADDRRRTRRPISCAASPSLCRSEGTRCLPSPRQPRAPSWVQRAQPVRSRYPRARRRAYCAVRLPRPPPFVWGDRLQVVIRRGHPRDSLLRGFSSAFEPCDPPCHGRSLHSRPAGTIPGKRGIHMAEQSISCPSCGRKIPLTRALRAEIETSLKAEYDRRLEEERGRAEKDAAEKVERKLAHELGSLK